MHWNAFPELLSQKDASQNSILESFFPGIVITSTTPVQPNFGPLFAFRNTYEIFYVNNKFKTLYCLQMKMHYSEALMHLSLQ
jgi:hypothetical protein